jgi:uncharacterized protein with gpF-like domain
MPATKAEYIKLIRDLTNSVNDLEDTALKQTLALLKDTLAKIRARILTEDGWRLENARNLQAQVNELIGVFEREAAARAGTATVKAYELGVKSVDDPLSASGIKMPIARISRNVVAVLQGYSADLIKNIAAEARTSINGAIVQGLLGQQSPFDTMKRISDIVGNPDKLSDLTGISARAEKIYRAETGRVFSIATQARQNQVAELAPDVMKMWVSTGDHRTRTGHLAAHGQIVKVNEPFKVAAQIGQPKEELMYPRDPAGSPGNVISCRCRSVTWRAKYGEIMPQTTAKVNAEIDKRKEIGAW